MVTSKGLERQLTLVAARTSMFYPFTGVLKVNQIYLEIYSFFKMSNTFQQDMLFITMGKEMDCDIDPNVSYRMHVHIVLYVLLCIVEIITYCVKFYPFNYQYE